MINAGNYNHEIQIVKIVQSEDSDGFPIKIITIIAEPYAKIKTTKGYTLIANNSDFEKAYTNFTIRYSSIIESEYLANNRNVIVKYKGKDYSIEYFNNIDEKNIEIEMQCKVVVK